MCLAQPWLWVRHGPYCIPKYCALRQETDIVTRRVCAGLHCDFIRRGLADAASPSQVYLLRPSADATPAVPGKTPTAALLNTLALHASASGFSSHDNTAPSDSSPCTGKCERITSSPLLLLLFDLDLWPESAASVFDVISPYIHVEVPISCSIRCSVVGQFLVLTCTFPAAFPSLMLPFHPLCCCRTDAAAG